MFRLWDREMEQISNGAFILDCTKMILSPFQAGTGKRIYMGAGSIAQTSEGKFKIKVYCSECISPGEVFAPPSSQPGALIEDSEYYSLDATDLQGRKWEADRILLDFNASQDFTGFVVEGDSYKIGTASIIPTVLRPIGLRSSIVVIFLSPTTHSSAQKFVSETRS